MINVLCLIYDIFLGPLLLLVAVPIEITMIPETTTDVDFRKLEKKSVNTANTAHRNG
jgi:hypothetical protein